MAQYNFDTLSEKYKGFTPPDCEINIDGYVLDKKYGIEMLTVKLTAMYEASCATFAVSNCVNASSDEFSPDKDITSKLKTGKSIEISMGYCGVTTKVFVGHIDAVEMSYDLETGFTFIITCLDKKGLMMNNLRTEIKTGKEKYSDAIAQMMNEYGLSVSISSTNTLNAVPIHQFRESDYEFLVRIAKKLNYGFYFLNGKVFFEPFANKKNELIEISPQNPIEKFTIKNSLKNRFAKVKVISTSEKDEKRPITAVTSNITAIDTGSKKSAKASSIMTDRMVKTIYDPSISTADEAEKAAQAEMDRLSYSAVEGTIVLCGIPEILPASFVSIKDFGADYEKLFFITRVEHRFSEAKYTTTIEIGGNNL